LFSHRLPIAANPVRRVKETIGLVRVVIARQVDVVDAVLPGTLDRVLLSGDGGRLATAGTFHRWIAFGDVACGPATGSVAPASPWAVPAASVPPGSLRVAPSRRGCPGAIRAPGAERGSSARARRLAARVVRVVRAGRIVSVVSGTGSENQARGAEDR